MKIVDINGMEREVKEVFPDPDYPGFVKIVFKRHHEWYSIAEFLQYNPGLSDITKKAPKVPDDVVGVVTSATKNSLRDASQNWAENAYMGYWCWVSRGKGEGQKRTVIKNSHNKVTLDKPWDKIPDKTSQYVLSQNVQDVKAFGNTLPLEDVKELERQAIKLDRARGRLNKDIKYLKEDEIDEI
jgi:hypothetical protein